MNDENDKDIFFNIAKPVIFAHRGGAAEAPESTIDAFKHGLCHGAHVLEFDVQLTKDGVPVVWHGPELKNCFNEEEVYQKDVLIGDWNWEKIAFGLWVAPPHDKDEKVKSPTRRIISLVQLIEFITEVKEGKYGDEWKGRIIHLNLELKKTKCPAPSWTQEKDKNRYDDYPYLQAILKILEQKPKDTKVIVGSADQKILTLFRDVQKVAGYGTYKTNLSLIEQIAYSNHFKRSKLTIIGKVVVFLFLLARIFLKRKEDLSPYAFETPAALITPELVEEVHGKNGRIYAFLSPFPLLKQPEKKDGTIDQQSYGKEVRDIVAMGVDGLMTDHPEALAKVL